VEAGAQGRASSVACLCLCLSGLAALAGGACESKGDVQRAQLLTASDLQALLQQDPPPETILDGYGLPGGMRLDRIITGEATSAVLVKRNTFTTEVWAGFDEVWIQPLYVAVEKYNPDAPPTRAVVPGKKWRPIFGVGPDSAFYSSYWQTIYFQIPEGEDLDSFRSVRDVLTRGYDLRPSEGRVMAIVPDSVSAPPIVTMPAPGGEEVGGPAPGIGYYDGKEMSFLDFGTETFTWNADLAVEEAPLFVWVARGEDGQLHALDMPTVAGAGPLYSGRKPQIVGGKPKYGSFWRIYTVELQKGWRVFAPPYFSDARNRLASTRYLYEGQDLPYAAVLQSLDADTAPSYADWVGRVLLNPGCVENEFAIDPSNKGDVNLENPDKSVDPVCQYVDAQTTLEALVPTDAIHRTDILVTCPFITYEKKALVLP
jgi:hypothetical protein